MKLQTLKSIIEKKKNKSEFAIITNISNGESEIFEKNFSIFYSLLSAKFFFEKIIFGIY